MDLILKRNKACKDGIFSTLSDSQDNLLAVTLEHAYADGTKFLPKLPPGSYKCVRGSHRLASMVNSFETFEITGVLGHTNILFHAGNYNDDSEGCVLLGKAMQTDEVKKCLMVTNSKVTFQKFMELQQLVKEFTLVVK